MSQSKALIAWSSGKDSAWALHEVRRAGACDVVGALTTVTGTFTRVSIHGVREELLDMQLVAAAVARARADGITHIVFGDLFLEDVRAYRERNLAGSGIAPMFPLWGRNTAALAREMIASGLVAHLVSVDLKKLPRRFAGCAFDPALLNDLPAGIDHCGENGEFHTFVSAGPMLASPVAVKTGEIIERDGAAYADLLPV